MYALAAWTLRVSGIISIAFLWRAVSFAWWLLYAVIIVATVTLWIADEIRTSRENRVIYASLAMHKKLDEIGWNPVKTGELRAMIPECERLDALLEQRTGMKGMLMEGIRFRLEVLTLSQQEYYYSN